MTVSLYVVHRKKGGYGYLELTDFANTKKTILLPEQFFFRTSWLELPVRGAGQGGPCVWGRAAAGRPSGIGGPGA